MSDQNVKGKSKYESPILVPLGEMAKGFGEAACAPGSGGDCTAGPTATRDCTAGPNALRACTQGDAATVGCTAGGHVAL
jgi:hypothetical protein